VLAGFAGDRHSAQHPRDFFDARVVFECGDLGARGASVGHLRDSQVLIAEGRNLRQMRHAKHLRRRAKRGEFATDDFGDRATDA
jgi:hypothetical protein